MTLIRNSGTSPEATMLVGDSAVDLETARRGGVRICLARYGFGYDFAPADFRGDEIFIDRPAELSAVIHELQ
jgi:phosphoglycolate phosphatase-like HAD superfamily hydrolase